MEKKRKLTFQMVPDGCWYSNLRSILSKAEWDFVRKDAYARAGGKCQACGRAVRRLEAHEVWRYDEDVATQVLTDVVALCPLCHQTVHIGRSALTGNGERCEDWYCKVNELTYAEMRADLGKANEDHRRRNAIPEWKLDLTYLKRYLNQEEKEK